MPIGPWADFDECVANNQDKHSPEGFCSWLENQMTEGTPFDANAPKEAQVLYNSTVAFYVAKEWTEELAGRMGLLAVDQAGWSMTKEGQWSHAFEVAHTRSVQNIEIFASGTWTDSSGLTREWTESELDEMVEAFSKASEPVHLKVGHTSDKFNETLAEKMGVPLEVLKGEDGRGQVSLGKMSSLTRRGTKLVASFEHVPEALADLIEGGQFESVSSEIEERPDGSVVLTAVALLGAEAPAVSSLAPLETATVSSAGPHAALKWLPAGPKRVALAFQLAGTEIATDELEAEFGDLEAKWQESIKGKRGAPLFRALLKEARKIFNDMIKKAKGSSDMSKGDHHTAEERLRSVGWMADGLGLKQDASIDEVIERLQQLKEGSEEENMTTDVKATKLQIAVEDLPRLYEALGLGEDADIDAVLAAIAQLKEVPVEETQSEHSNNPALLKRIEALESENARLENDKLVAGYSKKAEAWIGIPGKPEDLGKELAEIHAKAGAEMAGRVVTQYQAAHDMAVQSGVLVAAGASGSGRPGENKDPFDEELEAYAKENNTTRQKAMAHFTMTQPTKVFQYRDRVNGNNGS